MNLVHPGRHLDPRCLFYQLNVLKVIVDAAETFVFAAPEAPTPAEPVKQGGTAVPVGMPGPGVPVQILQGVPPAQGYPPVQPTSQVQPGMTPSFIDGGPPGAGGAVLLNSAVPLGLPNSAQHPLPVGQVPVNGAAEAKAGPVQEWPNEPVYSGSDSDSDLDPPQTGEARKP